MDGIFDSVTGFHWDTGNSLKNLIKHNVQNWECEQVFFNQPLLILDDLNHSKVEKRWAVFGKTDSNRELLIIFTKRNDLLRVISAGDMDHRERKYYEEYENKYSGI
jgi:uncharacterized protein